MRPFRDATTILGSLALVGTLVLLSPGIRAVRADDTSAPAESSPAADGPTREAGAVSGGQEVVETLQHIQRLQLEQTAAAPPASDAGGDLVVLNNRGYNYVPSNAPLPQGTVSPPAAVPR
jgi:hypothetical protein